MKEITEIYHVQYERREKVRERGERNADTVPPKSSSAPFQRSHELPIAFTPLLMAVHRLTSKSRRGRRDTALERKEEKTKIDVYRYKEPSLFVRLLSRLSFIFLCLEKSIIKGGTVP